MNPRIVGYLVWTDWRRLRVAVIALWIVIAGTALPYWSADFHRLSSLAGRLEMGLPQISESIYWIWSDPVLWELGRAVAFLLTPLLVVVCALIGICGGTWSGVRPVRRREWIAAKVVETALFAGVPLVAAVGVNLAGHGFPAWETMGMSARNVAPTLAAMVLCGVLCGTFRRWLGWIAGFAVFFVACSLLLQKSWLAAGGIDVWGASPEDLLRDVLICGGLLILISLKGRFRGFPLLAAGWPVVVAAMLAGLWFQRQEIPYDQVPVSAELEKMPVPEEMKQMGARRSVYTIKGRPDPIQFVGRPVETAVVGGNFVYWRPTGNIVASRAGEVVAESARLRSGFARLSQVRIPGRFADWDAVMPEDVDRAALAAALPADAGNLISSLEQGWTPMFYGYAAAVVSEEAIFGEPVDFRTQVESFLFRYEKVAELGMGEVVTGGGGLSQFRVAAASSSGVRVDFSKLESGEAGREFSVEQIAVVMSLPEKGIAFRLKPVPRNGEGVLLAGCRFSITRHQMTPEALQRAGQLYGPVDLRKARVLVYAKKAIARAEHGIHVPNVRIEDGRKQEEVAAFAGKTDPDIGAFFRIYLQRRPAPRACSEADAGRWMYRVLSLRGAEPGWVARELAPFVTRYPGLALRLPEAVIDRREMMEAVIEGFPADQKAALLETMRAQSSDIAFSAWFQIALERGWEEGARLIATERISRTPVLSDRLAEVAVNCGQPEMYPKILDAVRRGISWDTYVRIRELPEISTALDAAVADYDANVARHLRGRVHVQMIPASRGGAEAFKAMLEVLTSAAKTGELFTQWNEFLDVVRLPVRGSERGRVRVDVRFSGLKPEDFEWSAYLQQWLPKESLLITEP